MLRKFSNIIIFIILSCSVLRAGANPAAFLDLGVGARALGMGGAFTAVAEGPTASYWNPAGLGKIDTYQASMMLQNSAESQWPGQEDINPKYQFVNLGIPLSKVGLADAGTVGLSVISMGISDIPHTYMDNGTLIRDTFDNRETAFFMSGGYPFFMNDLMVGGSLKYITQDFEGISGGSASGLDLDAGILVMITEEIDMGFLISRGATLEWDSGHRDTGGVKSKVGVSYDKSLTGQLDILGAVDFIQEKDMPLKSSLGGEIEFKPNIEKSIGKFHTLSARAGINRLTIEDRYSYMDNLNDTLKWNAGAGLKMGLLDLNMQIDYTFSNDPLGNGHRISITMELI
ncbi:MAG: hypothetical protein ACQEQC_05400 [Elusimicrobiota bacterium]